VLTQDSELVDPILRLLAEGQCFAFGESTGGCVGTAGSPESAAPGRLDPLAVSLSLAETPRKSMASTGLSRLVERFAVGLSAGPDSSALAICAAEIARRHNVQVRLFHVHHGLMPQADAWLGRVEQLAALLDLELQVRHVKVDLDQGVGLEAAARKARHHALKQMAIGSDTAYVLLAHHLQDQAETVLQRLFRGAGVSGAAAMRPVAAAGGGAIRGTSVDAPDAYQRSVWWLRPWLGVSRDRIVRCVRQFELATGWQAVDDPSNTDQSLARGMIRGALAPLISKHWPGWVPNLARHAEQAQEASALLDEYGCLLLEQIGDSDTTLDLRRWRALTSPQQSLVLRTWLALLSLQMPSQRRLAELCRQLNQVHAFGHDRVLLWRQSGCEIRCIRGKIHLQVTI